MGKHVPVPEHMTGHDMTESVPEAEHAVTAQDIAQMTVAEHAAWLAQQPCAERWRQEYEEFHQQVLDYMEHVPRARRTLWRRVLSHVFSPSRKAEHESTPDTGEMISRD